MMKGTIKLRGQSRQAEYRAYVSRKLACTALGTRRPCVLDITYRNMTDSPVESVSGDSEAATLVNEAHFSEFGLKACCIGLKACPLFAGVGTPHWSRHFGVSTQCKRKHFVVTNRSSFAYAEISITGICRVPWL